jgi:hypothetical protein
MERGVSSETLPALEVDSEFDTGIQLDLPEAEEDLDTAGRTARECQEEAERYPESDREAARAALEASHVQFEEAERTKEQEQEQEAWRWYQEKMAKRGRYYASRHRKM